MTVSQKFSMNNASLLFYLEGGRGLALGTRGSVMRLVAEKTRMSLPKVFVLFHRPCSSQDAMIIMTRIPGKSVQLKDIDED